MSFFFLWNLQCSDEHTHDNHIQTFILHSNLGTCFCQKNVFTSGAPVGSHQGTSATWSYDSVFCQIFFVFNLFYVSTQHLQSLRWTLCLSSVNSTGSWVLVGGKRTNFLLHMPNKPKLNSHWSQKCHPSPPLSSHRDCCTIETNYFGKTGKLFEVELN